MSDSGNRAFYTGHIGGAMLAATHLRLARLWLWIGLALIFGICFLSVTSVPGPLRAVLLHDKVMHMVAYAGLMGWFAQIFRHRMTRFLFAAVFVGMGVGIEFVQATVPGRQFELLDMVANTSGIILAWALAHTWMGRILEWFESRVLRVAAAGGPVTVAS